MHGLSHLSAYNTRWREAECNETNLKIPLEVGLGHNLTSRCCVVFLFQASWSIAQVWRASIPHRHSSAGLHHLHHCSCDRLNPPVSSSLPFQSDSTRSSLAQHVRHLEQTRPGPSCSQRFVHLLIYDFLLVLHHHRSFVRVALGTGRSIIRDFPKSTATTSSYAHNSSGVTTSSSSTVVADTPSCEVEDEQKSEVAPEDTSSDEALAILFVPDTSETLFVAPLTPRQGLCEICKVEGATLRISRYCHHVYHESCCRNTIKFIIRKGLSP